MNAELEHTCSRAPESCPSCGHKDSRDGFEGFEANSFAEFRHAGRSRFVVRCPKCEVLHPDQSDHDEAADCDPCQDELIDEDRRFNTERA